MSGRTVNCPGCKKEINPLDGDIFQDSFLVDSGPSDITCPFCDHEFWIQPTLNPTYEIYEDEEQIMDFNEYQTKAKTTALYLDGLKERYPDLPEEIYGILGMSYVGLGMGEAGEVQGKIKKVIRDCAGEMTTDKKEAIAGELGDVLWYVAGVCSELGISMGDVAQGNIDKLFSRKERGVLKGSGDNR